MRRLLSALLCCIGFLTLHPNGHAAPEWQPATAEELSMTSDPAAPGAAAIFLYKEERSDDNLQLNEVYVREKILTEAAKKDADIEIRYNHGTYTINSVSGRTIHSDGTVIPFTGRPFDKTIVKARGAKYQARVFSLPDVQVGSIIEYHYSIRYDDRWTIPPHWVLQGEYFARKEYFRYFPLDMHGGYATDASGRIANEIAYVTILPPGVAPHFVDVPTPGVSGAKNGYFEMNATNIPPISREEFQPPIEGLSYRVLFYNKFFDSVDKFWKGEGKDWSKQADHFIGPGPAISQAVGQLVSSSDTADQKLHKIYAAVMSIENTDFTRQHSTQEEKAVGENPVKTSDDIWTRKRGSSDQIAMLFVGMARAAGMQAYLMAVTNRDRSVFQKNLPSMDQLDADIAIVQVDGKDQFFDPGSRYCTYRQLNWKHSYASGLRQIAGGTELAEAPPMNYKDSLEEWVARLQMDNTGAVTGIVQIRYTGAPALRWRQAILREDLTEETKEMENSARHRLPGGLNVKMKKLSAPDDPDKPLIAIFEVSGPIATGTSKRLFVPAQLFQSAAKPTLVSSVRINPVYFDYPYVEVDDVQITPPAGVSVESMPKSEKEMMQQSAFYIVDCSMKGKAVSITRQFAMGAFIFPVKDYAELRSFYGKVSTSDQEQLVFKADSSASGN